MQIRLFGNRRTFAISGLFLLTLTLCAPRVMGQATPLQRASSSTPSVGTASQMDHTNQPASPVTLKPTSIAPLGAGGHAELKGRILLLHLTHLGPGQYVLQVVRRLDHTLEPLGTITIADPTLSPDRQATDNKKEASANPESVLIQTDVQMDLSAELSLRDIERIEVLGAGGNAVLVGAVK